MRIDALRAITSARLTVIDINATVRTAASAFSTPHIGLLVVCDANGNVAGVVSKSDLVRHLANIGVAEMSVVTIMSRNVVSCRPEDDLCATSQRMSAQSLQNIPVLSADSKLLGVLDIRDAQEILLQQERYQEQLLINYVAGVGYQ
jgi:CBS domain-containing protein